MADEIIIWLDDKFCLTRDYHLFYGIEEYTGAYVHWKLLCTIAGYGSFSLMIGGRICIPKVMLSHDVALAAANKLQEGKSFDLSDFFIDNTNSLDAWFNIVWDPENNTFRQTNCGEFGISKTTFAFPPDGAKALVEDMTNVLKELKWI